MLTPAGLWRRVAARIHHRDPEYDGLRRAVRAAIVIPITAAVSYLIGGESQTTMFAIFGSVALLIVVDFPGNRNARALAYTSLGCVGLLLISLGTLVASKPWLAVLLMFVIGVVVSFSGLLSESIAAAQRPALMGFVLPVCTPIGPLPDRLLGWLIALAICVPSALFVLPPRHYGELRQHAAEVCRLLAARITGTASAHEATTAMDALRTNFLGAAYRPVALSAGSRALVRVVDDLQWLCDRVTDDSGRLLGPMAEPAVAVLQDCARILRTSRPADRESIRVSLKKASDDLRSVAMNSYRSDIVDILAEPNDAAAVTLGRTLLTRRTIGAAIGVTGRIVIAAAAADARPVWARVLGRRLPETGFADRMSSGATAVTAMTTGYVKTRAVAVRNSVRTGLGLAAAVTVTFVFPVEHGLWVVLGALSVLRSSALTTGTNMVRAVTGTVIGFLLGAIVIEVLGVDPIVMWMLLPLVAFGSAYVPEIGSFTAGQAAFTMMVLIVFNMIRPTGWQVGLIRLEDVIVGTFVAVIVSVLLWPRGASPWIRTMIDSACAVGAHYLKATVYRVTRGASEQAEDRVNALSHQAISALRTVDDALRHYLSESGGPTDSRAPVVRAANRAVRIRTAADVVADVVPPPLDVFPHARAVLEAHTVALCARLDGSDPVAALAPISDDLVPALRAESMLGGRHQLAVSAALPLVTVAANIGELELTYPPLLAIEPLPHQ